MTSVHSVAAANGLSGYRLLHSLPMKKRHNRLANTPKQGFHFFDFYSVATICQPVFVATHSDFFIPVFSASQSCHFELIKASS